MAITEKANNKDNVYRIIIFKFLVINIINRFYLDFTKQTWDSAFIKTKQEAEYCMPLYFKSERHGWSQLWRTFP